jgi:predicted NAD/FAD-binding protein
MKIAVVGTGIAGLGAAYALSRAHEVELFEANAYPGGHVNTVKVGSYELDTGFIVHNEPNYPKLTRLFGELGVATNPSEMSFAVTCACGVAWSSRRPWTCGPALLREITRFLRRATPDSGRGRTVAEYVRDHGYSSGFRRHFLVPMTAALWSTAPARALEFPAETLIRFLGNHGMLGFRRHAWRTVAGGSRTYVAAVLDRIGGRLHLGLPVRSLRRVAEAVELRAEDGEVRRFDGVVVATSAPRALGLLEDPSAEERRLLSVFRTTSNEAALHTDTRLLPRRIRDRSSWNVIVPSCGDDAGVPTMTYFLDRLQRLEGGKQFCVTLNQTSEIHPAKLIRTIGFEHPQVTFETVAAQTRLHVLNGQRRTAFAGAWQGFGFHEDGLVSGLRAAEAFGVTW